MTTLMNSPILACFAEAVLLALQVRVAWSLGGVAKVFITAQSLYWTIAFVARPLYLAWAKPSSVLYLGDSRLAWSDYGQLLAESVWVAVVGQMAFLAGLVFVRRIIRPVAKRENASYSGDMPLAGWSLWAVGCVGRLLSLAGYHAFDSILLPFGVTGACILIVFLSSTARRSTPNIVFALAGIEALWALASSSKSALLVPLLAVAVRWIVVHRAPHLARRMGLLLIIGLAGFFVVQNIRGIDTAENVAAQGSSLTSTAGGYAIGVLERFDGDSSIVDAVLARQLDGWLSPEEFGSRLVYSLVPKFGTAGDDVTLGQHWTREVRAQSFPNQYLGVSLAAGPSAEGFALSGMLGAVVENFILAAATIVLTRLVSSRHVFGAAFASYILFSNVLMEQGVLGLSAAVNKGVQAAIICLAVVTMVRSARTAPRRKATSHRPQLRDEPPTVDSSAELLRTSDSQEVTPTAAVIAPPAN